MNATLVIPHLEVNPVWQDSRYILYSEYANLETFLECIILSKVEPLIRNCMCFCSSFEEIFDVDHFLKVLRNEVSIVKELPSEFSWSSREYYATGIRATRVKTAPVHAPAEWYLENVLPILQRSVNALIFLA